MTRGPLAETLVAEDALSILADQAETVGWIDVRSEGEFARGHIPGFQSAPILNNEERHQVGLCYQQRGQQAAIGLGHRLVDPERPQRVAAWKAAAGDRPAIMCCWRGGLRSEIAAQWCREEGMSVAVVDGGYKAIRNRLLERLNDLPPLVLIAGLTGTGKTDLLQSVDIAQVDLEAIAIHRGSAFGAYPDRAQPAQASFENGVLLALRRVMGRSPVFMEDESAHIGTVSLPNPLRAAMKTAPIVILTSPIADRCRRIFLDYVADPIGQGIEPDKLCEWLVSRLMRIRKALGGQRHQWLLEELKQAFQQPQLNEDAHRGWIQALLTQYYDPRYNYGMSRRESNVLFQGDFEQCRNWISTTYG